MLSRHVKEEDEEVDDEKKAAETCGTVKDVHVLELCDTKISIDDDDRADERFSLCCGDVESESCLSFKSCKERFMGIFCCCFSRWKQRAEEQRKQNAIEWKHIMKQIHAASNRLGERRHAIGEVFPEHIRNQNRNVVEIEQRNFDNQMGSVSILTQLRYNAYVIFSVAAVVIGCCWLGIAIRKSDDIENRWIQYVYVLLVNCLWYSTFSIGCCYPFLSMFSEHFRAVDTADVDDEDGDSFLVVSSDLCGQRGMSRWEWLVATRKRIIRMNVVIIGLVLVVDALGVAFLDSSPVESSKDDLIFILNHSAYSALLLLIIPTLLFARVSRVDERRWARIRREQFEEEDDMSAATAASASSTAAKIGASPTPTSLTSASDRGRRHPHVIKANRLRFLALPAANARGSADGQSSVDSNSRSRLVNSRVGMMETHHWKRSNSDISSMFANGADTFSPSIPLRALPPAGNPARSSKHHSRSKSEMVPLHTSAAPNIRYRRIGQERHGNDEALAECKEECKESPEPSSRSAIIPDWETVVYNRTHSVPDQEHLDVAADGMRQIMEQKHVVMRDLQAQDRRRASIFESGNLVQEAERTILHWFYGKNSQVGTDRAVPIIICLSWLFISAYVVMLWFGRMKISLPVGIFLLFAVLLGVFFYERQKKHYIFFDLGYVLFYSTVMSHFPQIMGPFIVMIIEMLTEKDEDGREAEASNSIWSAVVPLIFALLLHLYLYVTEWLISIMAGPSIYSRFLYVGQIFRHTFWYIIFGLTPLGVRFFAMLFLVNVLVLIDHGSVGIRIRRYLKDTLKRYFQEETVKRTSDCVENQDDYVLSDEADSESYPPPPPSPPPPPPPASPTVSPLPLSSSEPTVDEPIVPICIPTQSMSFAAPAKPSSRDPVEAEQEQEEKFPLLTAEELKRYKRHHHTHHHTVSNSQTSEQSHMTHSSNASSVVFPSPLVPLRLDPTEPKIRVLRLPNQPMEQDVRACPPSLKSRTSANDENDARRSFSFSKKHMRPIIDDISNHHPAPQPAVKSPKSPDSEMKMDLASGEVNSSLSSLNRSAGASANLASSPRMRLPQDTSLLPESSTEYEFSYNNHQSKILDIIFETRLISQDLLADFVAMVTTPIFVWILVTYGSEKSRANFGFSSDMLWVRFGITIAVRCVTLYILLRIVNRRTEHAKHQLKSWSVLGDDLHHHGVDSQFKGHGGMNMFTIRLGMDARLHRNMSAAISTYLQNRNVCLEDVELFIERYLRDIHLPVSDMAFSKLSALHYTITNLQNCWKYFVAVSILIYFSVLSSFEQNNRWAFWNL